MDWKTDVEPILTGFVRHGLTVAAGSLGTMGALAPDQQTQFIAVGTALVLYVVGQLWSILQKRKQAAELKMGNGQ